MAGLEAISGAATALTEGLKIFADIKDRERKQLAEEDFTKRLQAAGGVENLSFEDLIGAESFLSRQKIDLARIAIQNRQSLQAREADQARKAESLIKKRSFDQGLLEEKQTFEAGQAEKKAASQAEIEAAKGLTTKAASAETRAFKLSQKELDISASKEAATVLFNRKQELVAQGVADEEAEVIAAQESEQTALGLENVQIEEIQTLSEEHNGFRNIPTRLLFKYRGIDFVDDELKARSTRKPEDVVSTGKTPGKISTVERTQLSRDAFFQGDRIGALNILKQSGMAKGARNAFMRDLGKAKKDVDNGVEVLNLIDDILALPDEEFGFKAKAKNIFESISGSLRFGGKPSVFAVKMEDLQLIYAKQKLSGVLSNQDIERTGNIIGAGFFDKGPEEMRQTLGNIRDELESKVARRRQGKVRIRKSRKGQVDIDIELGEEGKALLNKYLGGQ